MVLIMAITEWFHARVKPLTSELFPWNKPERSAGAVQDAGAGKAGAPCNRPPRCHLQRTRRCSWHWGNVWRYLSTEQNVYWELGTVGALELTFNKEGPIRVNCLPGLRKNPLEVKSNAIGDKLEWWHPMWLSPSSHLRFISVLIALPVCDLVFIIE